MRGKIYFTSEFHRTLSTMIEKKMVVGGGSDLGRLGN